jgi:biopolymer transport protein ExbD
MHHRNHFRRHRSRPTLGGNDGFQMAPFIDVIFVLLLFYMVKLGFQTHEGQLGLRLPGPESSAVPPGLQLQEELVSLDDTGALFHNEESVTPRELTTHFRALQQQSQSLHTPLLVTVNSSPEATYAEMTRLLEALQNAGVNTVTFQVAAEQ